MWFARRFSLIRIVHLWSCRLFFSRKRKASVALGSETEITMEVENVNPPCAARERLLIAQMEKYLEKSEQIQVEIRELEHFLLGPEEARYQHHVFRRKREEWSRLIASSCCSTHVMAKERVEALKWQMQLSRISKGTEET